MRIKDLIFFTLIIMLILKIQISVKWNPPNKIQTEYIKVHDTVYIDTTYITSHASITVYQPIKAQCDSQPLITSDGSKIDLKELKNGNIKWCAISQDLLYLFPRDKPKRIWIDGYGIYEVRDVMNKRFNHKVDILIHPKNSYRVNKENVKIKIFK